MTLNSAWFLNATGQFTPLNGIPTTSTSTGFLTYVTHSATASVAAASTSAYTDFGPGVNLGSTGVWLVWATSQLVGPGAAPGSISVKLWDGTTTLSVATQSIAANNDHVLFLSGVITNPAANLKISGQAFSAANQVTMSSTDALGNTASYVSGLRIG